MNNTYCGTDFHHYFLVLPKIVPFAFGDEPANFGESTNVQCGLAAGDLPVKFSWYFNEKPLDGSLGVNTVALGSKMSILSIDSLDETYAGNYTCLAQNNAGLSSYLAELIVKGTTYI